MRLWKRMRARMQDLDDRVAAAEELAASAEAEAAHSQERREHVHETLVTPLNRAAAHNQFADMIRATLIHGREAH